MHVHLLQQDLIAVSVYIYVTIPGRMVRSQLIQWQKYTPWRTYSEAVKWQLTEFAQLSINPPAGLLLERLSAKES